MKREKGKVNRYSRNNINEGEGKVRKDRGIFKN